MKNTQHQPQATLLGALRAAFTVWRRQHGWSRESVVHQFVLYFEAAGGPERTGIRFAPRQRDLCEAQQVDAQRFFHWLDDESKYTGLLPANVLPYVLAALPAELSRPVVDAHLLAPMGLRAQARELGEDSFSTIEQLKVLLHENEGAQEAVAALVDGYTPDEIERAVQELTESAEATLAALRKIRALPEAAPESVRRGA